MAAVFSVDITEPACWYYSIVQDIYHNGRICELNFLAVGTVSAERIYQHDMICRINTCLQGSVFMWVWWSPNTFDYLGHVIFLFFYKSILMYCLYLNSSDAKTDVSTWIKEKSGYLVCIHNMWHHWIKSLIGVWCISFCIRALLHLYGYTTFLSMCVNCVWDEDVSCSNLYF